MGDRNDAVGAAGLAALPRDPAAATAADGLLQNALIAGRAVVPSAGIVTGRLLAIAGNGCRPLVSYAGQPGSAALPARTTVDLYAPHIGAAVLLTFDQGDARLPIVIGVLREGAGWPLADSPGMVEVSADGERMIVGAREQLVLRCGKASITLARDGTITIDGIEVTSRAAGTNRVRGGSVQLN